MGHEVGVPGIGEDVSFLSSSDSSDDESDDDERDRQVAELGSQIMNVQEVVAELHKHVHEVNGRRSDSDGTSESDDD